jgi:hypothetical protein
MHRFDWEAAFKVSVQQYLLKGSDALEIMPCIRVRACESTRHRQQLAHGKVNRLLACLGEEIRIFALHAFSLQDFDASVEFSTRRRSLARS